ncbi:hypothetical protein U737_21035 [Methylomonas sp. LW13]|uniref:hypothetical protein n=1 Tax=unclassified Methylomonas TaxID=2608980 RepID=UPI00051BD7B9|nr:MULTISPECIES: hypothetical protein [unclassified Methylomonas]PKD38944.1 hypothetical protein CWO84_18020 [Methylomonas sp. Kb3]QBC29195.1 hypothetical protein U737_21035 [Methylomonas sp. LW13]
MPRCQTAKQEAIAAINLLPDTVNFEEIVYRLYVMNKIYQGLEDVEQGKGISSETLLREIEQW